MNGLFTYYRTGGSYHPLVDIALFHYQFETIHLYGDGNGRLGRLLITLQLYDAGFLERPNLYLSEYFNRSKSTYVERMVAIRFHGEWEAWLTFFIEGIARQARESVERTLALADLRREYEDEYGGRSYTKNQLAVTLFEQPYVTSKTVQRLFDVKQPTASRAINELVDEGVLEEVPRHGRNKEYRARETSPHRTTGSYTHRIRFRDLHTEPLFRMHTELAAVRRHFNSIREAGRR